MSSDIAGNELGTKRCETRPNPWNEVRFKTRCSLLSSINAIASDCRDNPRLAHNLEIAGLRIVGHR